MLKNIRKEGRNLTIDLLKAFAAILVILSHSLLKFIDSTQHNLFYNILFNFIWLTQMPLFMFISGFLNNKSEKFKTFRDFLY